MKPILMRMGCVGMLLLAAGIVDGAGSRPYSSQAFWPLLLLAMGIAVGGMGLGVRAELLDPGKDPETKRPRPCGNTDEAKEVEIAIPTKNIPCVYKKHKGEAGRRCGERKGRPCGHDEHGRDFELSAAGEVSVV